MGGSIFGGAQTVPQTTSQNTSQAINQATTSQQAAAQASAQTSQFQPNPWTQGVTNQMLTAGDLIAAQMQSAPRQAIAGLTGEQGTPLWAAYNQGLSMQPLVGQGQGYLGQGVGYTGQGAGLMGAAGQAITPQDINAFYNPMAGNVTAQLQNIFGQQNLANRIGGTQAAGGIGADRAAVGQGILANQQTLGAGQIYSQLYQNALQAAQQQKAQQLAAGQGLVGAGAGLSNLAFPTMQAGMGGLSTALQMATIPQQWQQQNLNAQYQQALMNYQDPFMRAQALGAMVQPTNLGLGYTQAGQQAGVTGGQQLNTLTGTQLGSGTGVSATTFPAPSVLSQVAGLGTAGLGLKGLLGGSDIRAKTDIQRYAKDPRTGIRYDAFRYKGDPKTYPKVVAPRAQDVAKVYPDAVRSVGNRLALLHRQSGGAVLPTSLNPQLPTAADWQSRIPPLLQQGMSFQPLFNSSINVGGSGGVTLGGGGGGNAGGTGGTNFSWGWGKPITDQNYINMLNSQPTSFWQGVDPQAIGFGRDPNTLSSNVSSRSFGLKRGGRAYQYGGEVGGEAAPLGLTYDDGNDFENDSDTDDTSTTSVTKPNYSKYLKGIDVLGKLGKSATPSTPNVQPLKIQFPGTNWQMPSAISLTPPVMQQMPSPYQYGGSVDQSMAQSSGQSGQPTQSPDLDTMALNYQNLMNVVQGREVPPFQRGFNRGGRQEGGRVNPNYSRWASALPLSSNIEDRRGENLSIGDLVAGNQAFIGGYPNPYTQGARGRPYGYQDGGAVDDGEDEHEPAGLPRDRQGRPLQLPYIRQDQADELDNNPQALARIRKTVHAEDPANLTKQTELIFNRAAARGQTLAQAAGDEGYYPDRTINAPDPGDNPAFNQALNRVVGGSNRTNFSTGNASQDTGFGFGRKAADPYMVRTPTGERYGVENKPEDLAWAKERAGWQGRDLLPQYAQMGNDNAPTGGGLAFGAGRMPGPLARAGMPGPMGGAANWAQSPYFALLQSGLGMLAASGQRDARGLPMSPLGAIGAGGLYGMQSMQQQQQLGLKQQALQDAMAHRKALEDLAMARVNRPIKMTDPETGEDYLADPNTGKRIGQPTASAPTEPQRQAGNLVPGSPATATDVAALAEQEDDAAIPVNARLVQHGNFDYSTGSPGEIQKGFDIPTPAPIIGPSGTMSSRAIMQDAEKYLRTGQLPPGRMGMSAKNPIVRQQQKYIQAIRNYAGAKAESLGMSVDEVTNAQRKSALMGKWILSPTGGVATAATGTVMRHIETLDKLYSAMEEERTTGTRSQAVNRLLATIGKQFGAPAAQSLDSAAHIVGTELIRALGVSGGGALADRQEAAQIWSPKLTPEQWRGPNGTKSTMLELLAGRLVSAENLAGESTVPTEDFKRIVGPENYSQLMKVREELKARQGSGEFGASPVRGAGPTQSRPTKVIGGKTYYQENGKWYTAD